MHAVVPHNRVPNSTFFCRARQTLLTGGASPLRSGSTASVYQVPKIVFFFLRFSYVHYFVVFIDSRKHVIIAHRTKLTLLLLQSCVEDKLPRIRVVCARNGTAYTKRVKAVFCWVVP